MTKYIKTEKRVYLGRTYRIHPSMAFLGIEDGEVKVEDFVTWDELPRWVDKEVYAEDNPEVKKEFWVKYTYTERKSDGFGEDFYFPAIWFADHITIY